MKKKLFWIIIIFLILLSIGLIYSYVNRENIFLVNDEMPYINNEVHSTNNNIQRTDDKIPEEWRDNGIFTKYYNNAYEKLESMSLDEKLGQIFLVRYGQNAINNVQNYKFGGYIFFEKDFKGKTKQQTIDMINEVQVASKIPLIIAVDEEGGTVVRISNNRNLTSSKFRSPRELYLEGEFDAIRQDTVEKSRILNELGINLNLAPVVDVSTNKTDYMYKRTLGEDVTLTSMFGKTVINASKGTGVSYCLKHFPGYGNNVDTHKSSSKDTRTYESIVNNDMVPFKEGINEGAEAVLVSHNVVSSIDDKNPASLSEKIHKILRDDLNFTGVIITDDLAMEGAKIPNATINAVLAGNDLIIVSDYEKSIKEVKDAIENGQISEETINKMAFKLLAWKYYKGLIDIL